MTDAVRHRAPARRAPAFRVVRIEAGVLDLSSRGDIASVASRLANVEVRL